MQVSDGLHVATAYVPCSLHFIEDCLDRNTGRGVRNSGCIGAGGVISH